MKVVWWTGWDNERDWRDGPGREGEAAGETLETIGRELNLTRERVRQIEARALTKIRIAMAINAAVGPRAADPILSSLQGKRVADFYAALAAVVPDARAFLRNMSTELKV